jgi:hypothetical protein
LARRHERIANLNKLIPARRFPGVSLRQRATLQPAAFFANRPELRGVASRPLRHVHFAAAGTAMDVG